MEQHKAPPGSQEPVYQTPRQVLLTFFPSIVLPLFMAAIDQTIVSTALPAIAGSVGDVQRVSWVVVAYLLSAAVVTPVYGQLGDALGRRRMMMAAMVLFMIASAACGLARTLPELAAARFLQGMGGGGLMALGQALIGENVPPRQRGRYQGYIVTVFVGAASIGPVAGGWLSQNWGWPTVFLVNLPLGVLALLLLMRLPARQGARQKVTFDFAGLALFGLFVIPLLLALEGLQRPSAEGLWQTAGLGALALAAAAGLLWQERRARQPLIPMHLLAQAAIGRCTALGACVGAIMVPMISFTPIYLELVRGMSPAAAGMALVPLTVSISIGSMATGQMITRTGHTALFPSIGQPLVFLVLIGLAVFLPVMPTGVLVFYLALVSLFTGTTMVVVQVTSQVIAGPRQLGQVAAVVQLGRSLGSSVGAALAGTVLFAVVSRADPGLAAIFSDLMQNGHEVLARLSPARAAEVQAELGWGFRAMYVAVAMVAATAAGLAWSLTVRRI